MHVKMDYDLLQCTFVSEPQLQLQHMQYLFVNFVAIDFMNIAVKLMINNC
jgi:hypothetical protein